MINLHNVAVRVNPFCSSLIATLATMRTPGERLIAAREAAGFSSAKEAAEALGIPVSTYNSHERAGQPGARGFKIDTARIYARRFGVSASWLLTGEKSGNASQFHVFRVVGYCGLGEEIQIIPGGFNDGFDEIELPFGFSVDDCAALICRGSSMAPRVNNGEVVIYSRGSHTLDELANEEAIVALTDGRVLMKRLKREKNGQWTLLSWSPSFDPILDAEIEWVGAIMAIVPGTRWRRLT